MLENDRRCGSIGGTGAQGAAGRAGDQAAGRRGEGGKRTRGQVFADAIEKRTKAKDIAGRMEEAQFKLI